MLSNKFSLAVALAAPLAFGACGGESGKFDLNLVHKDCTGQLDFMPPKGNLVVSVTGDGIGDPVSKSFAYTSRSGSVELPAIPFGNNRVVTVRAEANNTILAWGQSAPFNLKEGSEPTVTVIMQGVDRFTGAADTNNGCIQMRTARAGHVAVPMDDGDVLFVGGASTVNPSGAPTGLLKSAELYDIGSGRFTALADACDGDVCYDAVWGRGVLLKNGSVLVTGGQSSVGGTVQAVDTAMLFDPATQKWTALHMNAARFGHTATLLRKSGKVIVAGGMDATGTVLSTTEIFDPATNTFTAGPELAPLEAGLGAGRAFHAAVAANDTTVMLAGGIDAAGSPANFLAYFVENVDGRITHNPARNVALKSAALLPGAGMVKGKFVVAGGALEWRNDRLSGASKAAQWLEVSQTSTTDSSFDLAFSRAAPCAVSLDDNRLLIAGGVNATGSSVDYAEVVAWNASNQRVEQSFIGGSQSASKMSLARGYASCTNLGDGRILVAGGSDGSAAASKSAEIYTIRQFK